MSHTVSVIIPTFNRHQLVQEAIDSVLGQRGGARFEIIVVDDGSTAETAEALRKYGDRIRYVRQDNAGLNAARNHALRLATGEYVALLDDDDVWLPFKTSLELAALEAFPHAGFVHSNFYIWKPGGARRPDGLRTWFPRPYEWHELYPRRVDFQVADAADIGLEKPGSTAYYGDTYYWALFAPMVLPSAAIFRRAALDDLRFPEFDSTCGDWEFFARLSHRHGGVFVPEETTLNRSHEDTWRLTRTDGSVQLRRRVAFVRRLWRQDPEFMQAHRTEVAATEARWLRQLARRQFLNGDSAAACAALDEIKMLSPAQSRRQDLLIGLLARMPFSRQVAIALRQLRSG